MKRQQNGGYLRACSADDLGLRGYLLRESASDPCLNRCGNESCQLVLEARSSSAEVICLEGDFPRDSLVNIFTTHGSSSTSENSSEDNRDDTMVDMDMQRACAASLGINIDIGGSPWRRALQESHNHEDEELDEEPHTSNTGGLRKRREPFNNKARWKCGNFGNHELKTFHQDQILSTSRQNQKCSQSHPNDIDPDITPTSSCNTVESGDFINTKPSPILLSLVKDDPSQSSTNQTQGGVTETAPEVVDFTGVRDSLEMLSILKSVPKRSNLERPDCSSQNVEHEISGTSKCDESSDTVGQCKTCRELHIVLADLHRRIDALTQDREGILDHLAQREAEWEIIGARATSEILDLRKQCTLALDESLNKAREKASCRNLAQALMRARHEEDRKMAAVVERQQKIHELRLTLILQQKYITDLEHDLGNIRKALCGINADVDNKILSAAKQALDTARCPVTLACRIMDVLDANRADYLTGDTTNPELSSCDIFRFSGQQIGINSSPVPYVPAFDPLKMPWVKLSMKREADGLMSTTGETGCSKITQ